VTESLGTYLLIGLALSLVATVGGLLVIGLVLVRLPPDYFRSSSPRDLSVGRHSLFRRTGLFAKNLVGGVFIALGAVLTLPGVPGPGILTILIGLMLLEFPGKRRLELWLISRPTILSTINTLRRQYGALPLEGPEAPNTRTRS
jgi:hypothetical protein